MAKDNSKKFKVPQDWTVGDAAAFSAWADAAMTKKLKSRKAPARMRDKVALGVRTRLELLASYKKAVAGSLAYMAAPVRGFRLPQLVWRTADAIWDYAGDTSTDYNHYTKRFLLSGVITATTLYWLNDTSKNHAKTWAFLDQRIDNVLKIGQAVSSLKSKVRA